MKTRLTIEESAHLIELGIDAKLASKCDSAMKVCASGRGIIRLPESRPIFDLIDILSILPKEIDGSDLVMSTKKDGWVAFYSGGDIRLMDSIQTAPELIDALNQLAIWLLTEKKINLNNIEQ